MGVDEKSAAEAAQCTDEEVGEEFGGEEGQVEAVVGAEESGDGELMSRPHVHHAEEGGGNDGGEKTAPIIGGGEERRSDFDGEKNAADGRREGTSDADRHGGAHHFRLLGFVLVNALFRHAFAQE